MVVLASFQYVVQLEVLDMASRFDIRKKSDEIGCLQCLPRP